MVTDLVAGAGLKFAERGSHELKGLPGRWDLFAAIKRNLVKKFVGLLRPIIADRRTALIMAYHPSLTGLANRTGSSGSTGWRAAYRGNIWIEKDVDEDPTIDTGKRTLHVMKVTEGTPNQKINLRFAEGGVLVREEEPESVGPANIMDGRDTGSGGAVELDRSQVKAIAQKLF